MADAGRAIALALAAGIAAWWALQYTRGPAGLSTLWPASGIVCGGMLVSPRARWGWYLAAAFVAFATVNAFNSGLDGSTFALSAADTLDAAVVALILVRRIDDIADITRIRRLSLWASAATLVACAMSAAIAVFALHDLSGSAGGDRYVAWFDSHVLGMVIFATSIVVARQQGRNLFGRPGKRLEFCVELALLAASCWVVFRSDVYPFPFVIFLFLLLVVFRHRFAGFAVGTGMVAVIAVSGHALGHGPFMLMTHLSELGQTLALQAFLASACLFALPVAVVLTGRDQLLWRLAKSEREYRMLADHSHDLVVRFEADGVRRYVSPSVTQILGWDRDELGSIRQELVHPDDRSHLQQALAQLLATGGGATILFRVRHKDGRYLWIEANASRIPGLHPGDSADVIYSGRDVTMRVVAEKALRNNERRLQAITANLPAIVLHVDKDECYTFVNAYGLNDLGFAAAAILGKRVRDVVGEAAYQEISPYMRAALQGKPVQFEIERDYQDRTRYYQSRYVPDVGEDGVVNGFYAVSFDISELKRAHAELLRLVRHDSLTGVANRLRFIERLELAVARSRRSRRPVALLYLDLDHFKLVNDTHGHAAGDAVLQEFARRLTRNVRDVDLVARLGGDEFVVVLEEIDSAADAQAIADKLIGCLHDPILLDDGTGARISASVGIAFSTHPVDDPETLLYNADAALYEAKRAGRNVWRMAG